MIISCTKTELNSKPKIRAKLAEVVSECNKLFGCSEDETFSLILSAIRAEEWNIVSIEEYGNRKLYNIDSDRIKSWINEKVIPNTVQVKTEDVDLLKLTVFSLAMPYKMLKGETKATMTEKIGRSKRRDFQQIFSDTFIGKIGEIAFKKFIKDKFGKELDLDWEISKAITKYESDIVGSKKVVSIKSTDTLESIWAEAPKPAEYGIFIKVVLPKDFFMKILAHISSLKKFLRFVEDRINKQDKMQNMLKFIEETAYREEMIIKAYVCGFFETSGSTLRSKGEKLEYLGSKYEVYENKHVIKCDKLKYRLEDWKSIFLPLITP